jgi:hypothetical protein
MMRGLQAIWRHNGHGPEHVRMRRLGTMSSMCTWIVCESMSVPSGTYRMQLSSHPFRQQVLLLQHFLQDTSTCRQHSSP